MDLLDRSRICLIFLFSVSFFSSSSFSSSSLSSSPLSSHLIAPSYGFHLLLYHGFILHFPSPPYRPRLDSVRLVLFSFQRYYYCHLGFFSSTPW